MTEQEYRDQLGITQIRYLGDSVYAGMRGDQICIWCDNGYGPQTVEFIYLADCAKELQQWLQDLQGAAS